MKKDKVIVKGPTGYISTLIYSLSKKPPLGIKTNFFRLMAVSQESGLGMRESIKSIMGAETNDEMKIILYDVLQDINEGRSLGYAVSCHKYFFDTNEIELIKAAEKMGNLPEVLKDIANELEGNEKLNAKIKKALMYPIGVMTFAIIAVGILLVFVIPTMAEMYGDAPLPGITRFMMGASDFVGKTWWIIISAIIVSILVFKYIYSNILMFKKFVDSILLKTPVIKDAIKIFYMYKFSKLYGAFGKAGVSPTDALGQLMNIFKNFFYKRKMLSIKNDLENGFTISDSIEGSELFDPILIQIIMVGEKTGSMADILITMASFYDYQLKQKIDNLTAMIEPIMMGFIACLVGTIVASIFLPMGGLLENIGQ